jgi:type IV pilus assembly protein PilY1
MNIRHTLLRLMGALIAAGAAMHPASAEDIDIYTANNGQTDVPNVLMMLDNSANWSASLSVGNCFYNENGVPSTVGPPSSEQGTKMAIEKCALYNVIDALPTKSGAAATDNALFNVGLMLLNESPASNAGAYPRQAFIKLTTANKAAFKTIIKNLSLNGDKGNNAAFAKAMYEMFLYYKGSAPYKGNAGTKYDAAAYSGGRYVSPSGASCGANYIIFIGNGNPQGAENNDALSLLADAGGNTTQITYSNTYIQNSTQANWADEYARFMRGVDVSSKDGTQNIITHTVAVTGASSDGTFPNFMLSMANYGGGTYTAASDANALVKGLLNVFNSIQAVNSAFASASLPVAVNAQGTYLNQVFIGMFRPDAEAKQRWRGNLKQYRFALDSLGKLKLIDANGSQAVNSGTGFIMPSAVSYWTTDSSFWANQQLGTPLSSSDSPDGEVVEKGGAAQRLRTTYASSQATRRVYTCVSCQGGATLGSGANTQFSTSTTDITAAALGVSTATDRSNLIDWVRGTDNAGDESGPGGSTTVRPSIHGDVLHSRPAVINYGGTTGVVVFYGANDGMLHAVNGNQTGTGAGEELWSFVPQEFFPRLNRLRTNTPEIKLSTTPEPTSATPRDYFVDGPIGVYQKVASGGANERVILYVSMRRGGRALYAIDVTTPSAPRYLWRKTNSDLPALGQTWSEPRVARIKGNTNPVVIFGGGYDASAEDSSGGTGTTMGNTVFVLDAIDGTLLKQFGSISRSVAADVTVVDSDFDGKIDRAYAVDLGGSVWRIDFETPNTQNAPADWTIYQLADLSGGTATGRKFFFSPSVVVTKNFTALLFGSGDREKPLLSATQDHFFQIFDRTTAKGKPATFDTIVFSNLTAVSDVGTNQGAGCYLALATGEKVVNSATTMAGSSFFGTNQPTGTVSSNSCSANLGIARGYNMPLFCKSAVAWTYAGGGLPPSPISGTVQLLNTTTGETMYKPFVMGGLPVDKNCTPSPLQPCDVTTTVDGTRKRIYWYSDKDR